MLNHLSILQSELIHYTSYPFRAKKSHQFILKRDKELRRTRVTLSPGTTSQLTVHPPGFMSFSTYNSKTTGFTNIFGKFYVCSSSGHVGSNCNGSGFTGFCNNLRFTLVQLCIKYIMFQTLHLKHPAK